MAKINERIKERRLAKNLTLLEVAEELGVKEATVQRYESGAIKNIPYETIENLAKIFDCSPEYLMGWSAQTKRLVAYYDRYDKANGVVAAHKEGDNLTPDELKEVEKYIELLLRARKNNDET